MEKQAVEILNEVINFFKTNTRVVNVFITTVKDVIQLRITFYIS